MGQDANADTNTAHILVVEDETAIARAITLKLENAGFRVTGARDGEKALETVRDDTPDFMLLDIVMPNLDGFGVLETVREEGFEVPVAVMSNLSQPEDKQKMEEFGIEKYFVKSDAMLAEIVEYVKTQLNS